MISQSENLRRREANYRPLTPTMPILMRKLTAGAQKLPLSVDRYRHCQEVVQSRFGIDTAFRRWDCRPSACFTRQRNRAKGSMPFWKSGHRFFEILD